MLTRERCREIVDRALRTSKADEVQVDLRGGETSHLRFARNTPSTSGTYVDDTLSVTCTFGRRSGTASVNQLDARSIAGAVRRAEEIARRAPEDPEHVPALGPQEYAAIDAWSERTAERGAELMAEGVATCLEQARASGLIGAGFTRADAGYRCTANSKGLFGYHTATDADFSETVRTPDATGSGWATAGANGVEDVPYARCSEIAIDKARRSASPAPLAPGKYVTILEPACVANLLELLTGAMGARSADEGRTWFSAEGGGNRIGEQLFPETIELFTDPTDARAPGRPWGEDGLPQRRRDLIRGGRTPPRARNDSGYVVPALKVSEFTLSSVSEAV